MCVGLGPKLVPVMGVPPRKLRPPPICTLQTAEHRRRAQRKVHHEIFCTGQQPAEYGGTRLWLAATQ